jgi:DNA polymerase-3 subunit epsilon
MREIVLDTETTGFDPLKGDRLVEIGCVEIINHLPTGEVFHRYFNPDRDVPEAATRVHGLTNEFLTDKPYFPQEVDAFLDFIAGDQLVIHNAAFDMGFLNAELSRAGYKILPRDRAIDTLAMAREKFPGAPASLDALCKRFGIDLSERGFHGALLDARLLAEVYLELQGGRQPGFEMKTATTVAREEIVLSQDRTFRAPRAFATSAEEHSAHEAFISKIPAALWRTSGAKEGKN